jgi:hypothetical protein
MLKLIFHLNKLGVVLIMPAAWKPQPSLKGPLIRRVSRVLTLVCMRITGSKGTKGGGGTNEENGNDKNEETGEERCKISGRKLARTSI